MTPDTKALLEWVQYQPQLVTPDTVVVDRRDWDQLIGDVAAAAGWVAAERENEEAAA